MLFKKIVFLCFVLVLALSLSTVSFAEDLKKDLSDEDKEEDVVSEETTTPKKLIKETLEAPVKLIENIIKADYELEPIVVTPWGSQEYTFNISKNISVITEDEIKRSSASTVPELLHYRAGVNTTQQFGSPKMATVDIRGFGEGWHSNVLVLIDGRRTNQVDLSGVDWAQINLNTIERVEVVRGASSVLYGDNATGGVINIITKRGSATEPNVKLGSSLGSHNYHTEHVTLQNYHDIADYFFNYTHYDTDGFRENNDYKANDWYGRIMYHPVDFFELGTYTGYHKDEYRMPSDLQSMEVNMVSRRGTMQPDDHGKTEDQYLTLEPKFYLNPFDQNLTVSVRSTFRHRESEGLNIMPGWQGKTEHKIDSKDIESKLALDSVLWDDHIDNTFICGSDYFSVIDNIMSGDLLGTFADRDTVFVKKESVGLYLYDNVKVLDRFLFNSGYRYEWVDYKFKQIAQAANEDGKAHNEWAFELGSGYKYNPRSQAYLNFSRSYRYPNTEEYYGPLSPWGGGLNTAIRPQVGRNLEIGLKDNSLKWLNVNADFFWISTKNEIYLERNPFGNTNYPKTKRRGFDVEARVNLFDRRLMPYISYTRQRAKFQGGQHDNNDIPLVPANKFSTGVALIPIKNLTWNVVYNYVGSRYAISDNRNRLTKLGSYSVVDTKLSYKWKGVTVYGTVTNLFNRIYADYGVINGAETDIGLYYSPERRYEVGAGWEF